jgi:hypothetical protein
VTATMLYNMGRGKGGEDKKHAGLADVSWADVPRRRECRARERKEMQTRERRKSTGF